MPREFKYDVVQLIHGVRDRPCLWDKTLENYKDRVERRAAWEEIFTMLDERYEDMSAEEKRITGEHILNKWTNVRDTFVKTLKTKMGKPKRKYLLHDHLKFLTKVIPEEECNVDYNIDEIPVTYMKQEKESERESTSYSTRETRKRSKTVDYNEEYVPSKRSPAKEYDAGCNDIDFVQVDEANDGRIMNEDEAFFASLLPTIVKYNEDERLQFRIEVLAVMKRIKENRKWSTDD